MANGHTTKAFNYIPHYTTTKKMLSPMLFTDGVSFGKSVFSVVSNQSQGWLKSQSVCLQFSHTLSTKLQNQF